MAKFMKVRIVTDSIAGTIKEDSGPAIEFCYVAKQVVLVPSSLAEKWVESGIAERVSKDEPITETSALTTTSFLEHDPRLLGRMRGYMPS